MDNHYTEKSYQLYIRKTKDIAQLVDLGPEMYYEDPKAKRTPEKGQRSKLQINTQMTPFT